MRSFIRFSSIDDYLRVSLSGLVPQARGFMISLNPPIDLSPRSLLHIATHPRDASRAQYPKGDSANSLRVSERGARRSRRLVSLTGP